MLGTGEYAQSIAREIDIAAFVDDFTTETDLGGRHRIVRSTDLPAGSLVVVASMLRPKSALASVRQLHVDALDYFAFAAHIDLPVKPVSFWPEFAEDYRANYAKYIGLRERLADKTSRKLLDDLCQFRLNGDLSAMTDYEFDPQGQYFEDFLELKTHGESFIDIGSFDGQTSLEFASRVEEFDQILAFEPSNTNFPRVQRALEDVGGGPVEVLRLALGATASHQRFHADGGSSSRLVAHGNSLVSVVTLDSLELEVGTFIKMDIEGGEVEALRGARTTIQRLYPRLAISVYHRYDDLWRIPEEVAASNRDYKIYLRHYTEGIDETVMFFVPVDHGVEAS